MDEIKAAADLLNAADALIILAGAGMGVDSGLPDYRGDNGLWREYPALKRAGLSFEQVANPRLFESHSQLAWDFYGHRRALYRSTSPHKGFSLLKKWGDSMTHGYFVYTSNVDGHFQAAGFDSDKLVECHGNIHRLQCSEPCGDNMWEVSEDAGPTVSSHEIIYCQECFKVARPNVMMFNDWEWNREATAEQQERFGQWLALAQDQEARVAIVEIGAGTGLPAIRRVSDDLQRQLNGQLVRINLREAECPDGGISLELSALEAIEQIDTHMRNAVA